MEQAIQRYIDLFDFAPIGYVTFDRFGRIEEINFAAVRLVGRSRRQLIGGTFAVCVAKEDTQLFLHHLLECRSSDDPVVTELQLRRPNGEKVIVQLSSTPTFALMKDGVRLYQTAIVDLTERERAQSRLQRAIKFDEAVMTNMGEGLYTVDNEGLVTTMNPAAEKLFGWSFEELRGKKMHDVTHYKHRDGSPFPAHGCPGLQVLQKGKSLTNCQDVFIRKDGTYFDVIYSSSPICERNKITGLVVVFRDVTDQKRTDQALAEAAQEEHALYEFVQRLREAKTFDEIYGAALDAILAALHCDRASILLFDADGVMRFVDWRGLSARYRKAVEGHSPWKPDVKDPRPVCMTDVHLAEIPEKLKSIIETEGICAAGFIPLVVEEKLVGKFMTYYNTPHVFTDDELKLATTIATQLAQAIRQKRDELALRESEARLRAIVEQATAGMAHCDVNGRITFANRKLCQMLRYEESQLIGKPIAQITHRDDMEDNMRRFRQMIRAGKPFDIETRYIGKDGSILWADVSASAVRGPDGKTQSSLAVVVDVTARKKAEAALQRAKKLLQQRVRNRTRELRKANKELETEIERRKGLEGEILAISDREQQRLGQELHDGLCQHLTAVAFMARSTALRLRTHRVIDAADIEKIAELVNDAAIDTRNLSRALHRVDVDAAGLVVALQDLVDREIWRTPCRLEARPSFRIDDDAAASQLYRIAREAVINANKHAQARQIVLTLERVRKEMVLRVIDDGTGLPKELRPQQGLGFHIMKYRAQLMGGRLEVDSPPTGGTRMSCYLPDGASKRVSHKKERERKREKRERERTPAQGNSTRKSPKR